MYDLMSGKRPRFLATMLNRGQNTRCTAENRTTGVQAPDLGQEPACDIQHSQGLHLYGAR